ncbi:hypothetical protein K469DRAFT_689942 [Zopfia rhizophila CBS 207.26]|uniref:GST C-terminal domain-containing protein n=1 Tax=Zopfia rhizophila CBS 207.26 TaxID=1314779 RepID=A0A6A6DUW3_9PEZI|nr:hypothetical protein K469DRAFT_689942 [Zopfia rhizophila CBS 207.26]
MSPSPTSTTLPKTTLWLWPSGLYPRRLTYYFLSKSLPPSILSSHNIHLIPVILDPVKRGLFSKPGYEERPTGSSLPILRIEKEGKKPFHISESSSILEYFEELFSAKEGYQEMIGRTPEQRARTRDIVNLVNDAVTWSNVVTRHTDPKSLSWSGMTQEQWSESAATDAKKQVHKLFSKLETWVGEDVIRKGCKSLSGEGMDVSLADMSLMAAIMYAEDMHKWDLVEEHGVLRVWCESAKKESWVMPLEEIYKLEREGLEGLFVK